MIVHKIEQKSEEWNEIRKGKLTASNFSKILTKTGKLSSQYIDVIYENLAELHTCQSEYQPTNFYMERGLELEEYAILNYESILGHIVDKVGFIESKCGMFGVSPDGLVGNDGMIEIKCLMQKKHMALLLGEYKEIETYMPQIQFQLFISKRKWVDFISFNPDFIDKNKSIFIKRIFIDEEYHKLISKAIEQYKEKFVELSNLLGKNNIF